MAADPFDDPEWHDLVERFRSDAVKKISESAFTLSLCPRDEKFDVKFALELGASIMMNKPIVVLRMPGQVVPLGLRRIAHKVITGDLDTQAGQAHIAAEVAAVIAEFE